MSRAELTITSKNYSSWSLRGWLLCRMADLEVEEKAVPVDDPDSRQELLLLSPSFLVPRLTDGPIKIWGTLAIAEHLNELAPEAGLLPTEPVARAHCRAISCEIMVGFQNLRSALPMNLRAKHTSFPIFSGARPDIARVETIWSECLETYGGPFLFGSEPTIADAMCAPFCTRFHTYGVTLGPTLDAYCDTILSWPLMVEWIEAALSEPDEIPELDIEF